MSVETDELQKRLLNPKEVQEHFKNRHYDAVLWSSERRWRDAIDPDQLATAYEAIATTLTCISNDSKRNAYYPKIAEAINAKVASCKTVVASIEKEAAIKRKTIQTLQKKASRTEDEAKLLASLSEEVLQMENQLFELKASFTEKIKEVEIKQNVKKLLVRGEKEAEEQLLKAKLSKQIETAADAGLPEELTKDDVWAALKYGIYEHDNVYYSRGAKGDSPISNFTMKIIYHVDSNDDQAFRLISIKNVYGIEMMININTDDFVSVMSFKKVLARRGDFIFKGNDSDLCRLQEYLQKDEVSAKRIEILGWNARNKFWAWSNGLTALKEDGQTEFLPVDQYGIVEFENRKFFIPACAMMYTDKEGMFANEKKFIYTQPLPNFGFEEWSRLMFGAYQQKAIPAILFYIGSIFRDLIFTTVRRYPLLNLFGPPGAGKGEMYDSLMHMFGFKQDQIMLGGATTVVGFMRKMAQFKNAIVGLDEYKNTLVLKVIESLKNLYDGIGYERGKMSNDFATESTPVSSSTILSGQDMPTAEPALFMRCIMLSFEEGKFTETQRSNFQRLKNDYEHHGLSYITADLLQFRTVFEQEFKGTYTSIFKQTLKDVANVDIDDRMTMNISILLTIMHLTKEKLQFPFTYNTAKAWLIDNMMQQHLILANNSNGQTFWLVVENLLSTGAIKEGSHFIFEDGFLLLNFGLVHALYKKWMIDQRNMNYLELSTLLYHLQLDKVVCKDYYKHTKGFPNGTRPRVLKMDYARLGIDLLRMPSRQAYPDDQQYKKAMQNVYDNAGLANPDNKPVLQPEHAAEDLPFPIA